MCPTVADVRLDPTGWGKALWLVMYLFEELTPEGCKGENLEAGGPHNTLAELRRKWRPEAAWLCAVCQGYARYPRPWKKGWKAWDQGHDCWAHGGLWWWGSSGAVFFPDWCARVWEWLPSPISTEALRHECLQVGACLRSREHWFLPWVVVEAANLIRQSIKDSVWMGIDHGAGLVRWDFFLMIKQLLVEN